MDQLRAAAQRKVDEFFAAKPQPRIADFLVEAVLELARGGGSTPSAQKSCCFVHDVACDGCLMGGPCTNPNSGACACVAAPSDANVVHVPVSLDLIGHMGEWSKPVQVMIEQTEHGRQMLCRRVPPTLLPLTDAANRDAVVLELTNALTFLGAVADEAGERTSIDLTDGNQVMGLAMLLTTADPKGHDGDLGSHNRDFWTALARHLGGQSA